MLRFVIWGVGVLSDYRGMAVDIEFLLAGHPCLFFRGKACVEGLYRSGVFAAICGGAGDVHPLFAVENAGNKFADKKCRGEITGNDKADILLFAADESAADIVAGIAEIDVYIIPDFSCHLKRMLN